MSTTNVDYKKWAQEYFDTVDKIDAILTHLKEQKRRSPKDDYLKKNSLLAKYPPRGFYYR